MIRLLLLLPFLATALAGDMYGSNSYGSGSGSSLNGSGSSDMNSGSKSSSMSSENIDGATVDVTVDVTVIESSMGGSSSMDTMAAPPMATGMTHMVTVGGGANLVYSPPTIEAAVGDMVQFTFLNKNHTLTQSTFPLPCVKMAGGIDSEFMPNINDTVVPPPTFMVQVTAMTPMWFYCKQKGHCGKGMVFSINPTAAKSQANFVAAAIAQNGTAASGYGSSVVATYSTSVAAAVAAPAVTSTITSMAMAAATFSSAAPLSSSIAAAAAVSTAGSGSMVAGTGSGSGDSCSCSCLCGMSDFPAMAGMGNYGGMGGSVPAS